LYIICAIGSALFPLCCVAPVKSNSNVAKSTNTLGGKVNIFFCPLVAVVCPLKGTIFEVCLLTPIICLTRYNMPDGIAGGIFTIPPGDMSEYDDAIIYIIIILDKKIYTILSFFLRPATVTARRALHVTVRVTSHGPTRRTARVTSLGPPAPRRDPTVAAGPPGRRRPTRQLDSSRWPGPFKST
jgi:hypothetical protein